MSRRPIPSAGSETSREEKALVERMLAGDESAMNDFADGYFPGLYRFALGRLHGDSELTREIVQTTVCKALAKLGSYRGQAPLFTWLCACCRNEIGMHFRRQKRSPRVVEIREGITERSLPPNLPGAGGPEETLTRKEEARRVHTALDLLPARWARALEWKHVDHLSVQEIGQRLGCTPKAAESLLGRARRAFRERYRHLGTGPEVESDGSPRESGVQP